MKFRPIIVTAMAFLSLSLVACQKSAKDAAKEGNAKVAEVVSLSNQLSEQHNIFIMTKPGSELEVRIMANIYKWDQKRTSIGDIRAKLNGVVSRVDDIFKTDRRKDVRIDDPQGNLLRAKQNALAYLASLESFEKTGKTGHTKAIEKIQLQLEQQQLSSQEKEQLEKLQQQQETKAEHTPTDL